MTAITKAAAALGKIGGRAGTGKSKARSSDHCRNAQKRSVEARRRNAKLLRGAK